jgi:AcrR family transcriptional regulator
MAVKRRTRMRKQPRQARAQGSVDAILEAATRVLEKSGLEQLTTVRVAEVAGVSVGTLYQYFPNKEAILGALIERRFDELLAQYQTVLEATRAAPIDVAVRAAISGLVHYNLNVGARLHAPFIESISPTGRFVHYRSYMQRFVDILAAYLASRAAELRVTDVSMAAFLLVSCADGIAQGLAFRPAEPADAERLTDEATALVSQYLLPLRPAGGGG